MVFQKGNKYGKANKGRKISEETRQKLIDAAKIKDKSFYKDPERNRKISESRLGEKHPLWKGDKVSRVQLHQWVRRHKPKPELCEDCGKNPPYDLANISQEYKRDLNDFEWICRSCHMKKDGRLKELQKNNKKCRNK
jgi:hypothetical protein